MSNKDPIIIIGSGLAGYNVAREFRKLNSEQSLVIIADDAADFYSKPMLSNALAQKKSPGDLPIADANKMADDLNARVLNNTRVLSIDPEQQTLITNNNETFHYSKLVLATGAIATPLKIHGNASDKFYAVNDLESYARFREAIKDKKRIAIIGSGLIGCEFANDLMLSGYDVSVIGIATYPLDSLLPEQAAAHLQQALDKQGIHWYLGEKTAQINFSESVFKIEFESGASLEVDVVLSAIGIRPAIQLASDAGIEVNRAIIVNQSLQTSYENIYALGDCAQVAGLYLPFVMPLMGAARALAKTLNGELTKVTYPAMPVIVKTPSCPVVSVPPKQGVNGQWQIEENENGVTAKFLDDNDKLQGFALVGEAVSAKATLLKQLPAVLV